MTNLSNNGMVIDMGNVFLLFSIYTSHAMNYIIMYVLYQITYLSKILNKSTMYTSVFVKPFIV